MGKRGPKPTPTATLKIRGSWRGKSRQAEPAPEGRAVKPRWVKKLAAKKWDELRPQLDAMGVLSKIDAGALARYCDTWAWWRATRDWLEKNGEFYEAVNKSGDEYTAQYPQVNLCLKLAQQLSKLEAEFGLTPSARTNMQAVKSLGKGNKDLKKRFFTNSA